MGEDLNKLSKRTRKLFEDYGHNCIEIWENQLGQLTKEEQISEIWASDQSSQRDNDSIRTPEKQLRLLSNNFSDEDETPPLSQCYAPKKKVIKLSRL